MDIATTAIASTPGFAVAVNLDSAEAQGVVITEALLAETDYIVEGGIIMSEGASYSKSRAKSAWQEMTLEERRAQDAAFLENLQCTPDLIAEQLSTLTMAEN